MEDKLSVTEGISRRRFLKTAGSATFAITAYVAFPGIGMATEGRDTGSALTEVNAWVRISADGMVTIYNPAAEMGQGSMTALPVIIAEEMDLDWDNVTIENSPIEPSIYGRGWGRGGDRNITMLTVGSYSVRSYFDSLRKAGAQARYIMMHSAATHWSVPIEELTTLPGIVVHHHSSRKISYGELAPILVKPRSMPEVTEEMLKDPAEFRLIGNSEIRRFDIPSKVDGSAVYSMDVHIEGLHYAVMNRISTYAQKPSLDNRDEILGMPGVTDIVDLDHGIAVVAKTIGDALRAKEKMRILSIGNPSHTSEDALIEYGELADSTSWKGSPLIDEGDVDQTWSNADRIHKSDYYNDYVYHAQMEPLNTVVRIAEDATSAEVWVGTQGPAGARQDAADTLGVDTEKITLYPQYLGGGFGRRSMSDNVVEAVIIARETKRPIKLIWTRQDDLRHGAFRPQSLQRMKASTDSDGNITGWQHIIVGTGENLLGSGASLANYTVPNKRVEIRSTHHEIRTKHWRAVGHGPNHFAIESFIDEIAMDRGISSFEFRSKLLKDDKRGLHVLNTLDKMMRKAGTLPDGRARGIAFGERSGSLTAGGCEISFDENTGRIRVHKFWAALDAGIVIQPDNVIAQMEGAILMGMSSVMYERITFRDGQVVQTNFNDYEILRMSDVPESIEVQIIKSSEHPSGVGEAGLPFVGPAIGNAFAALTGKRLRHMPFTPERVKEVLGD